MEKIRTTVPDHQNNWKKLDEQSSLEKLKQSNKLNNRSLPKNLEVFALKAKIDRFKYAH